jgi:FkbM family methyltransferase
MDVEFRTDYFAEQALRRLDPARRGAVIEIGLGRIDFSFTWARRLGFRCIAIEPLPTSGLIEQARRTGTMLVKAAVSDSSGEMPLYLGTLDGHDVPDLSSLNPRWWGAGRETRMVRSMTLAELVRECSVGLISFLKLDTEGTESSIIGSLDQLERDQLPQLLAFEYGGGGCRAQKCGGWSGEFLDNTVRSLDHLRTLGYQGGILVESGQLSATRVDFAQLNSGANIFADDAAMGNFLALRLLPSVAEFEHDCARLGRARIRSSCHAIWRERLRWVTHQRIRLSTAIRSRLFHRHDVT